MYRLHRYAAESRTRIIGATRKCRTNFIRTVNQPHRLTVSRTKIIGQLGYKPSLASPNSLRWNRNPSIEAAGITGCVDHSGYPDAL